MRRTVRWAMLCLLAVLLGGCMKPAGNSEGPAAVPTARAEQQAGGVRLFAVNVGKGDALILRVGEYTCLIDAGKASAMGRVTSALAWMGVTHLNGVFLTHTDNDHCEGLEWLAASDIPVDNWYASAMYTGVKAEKHPAVKAAGARGQEVRWLRRGDTVSLGTADAALRVLAPASLFDDKDDNNSLVMMLECPGGRILFTGDMELPEEAELLAQGDDLSCAVLKVANHGDDDTTSEAFAGAASARIAVITTDSQEKPGTPDPGVVERLASAGSRVVVTQDAGLGLLVTLADDGAAVEGVDIDAAPVSGIAVEEVDASDDRVTLVNRSGEIAEMGGFYLYSDRGDELYAFPEGTRLGAGESLRVGTLSTDGDFDLLWDDKKVIHRKKTDVVTLYDPYGRAVDSRDNGL